MRWLGLERARVKVGLRPHREFAVALPYDEAFSKTLEAFELVLGASVWSDDRIAGTIEAGFGIVNSERIRATLERAGEAITNVRVEAFFPAGVEVPERSRYVDALAAALRAP